MICETCGKEHDGTYGTGRFCCTKCAKSFSTKRDDKTSLKLAYCIDCGKEVYINKRRSITTCRCKECSDIHFKRTNCNVFNNINCEDCYFKIHNICINKGSCYHKFKTLEKYCNLHIDNDYNTYLNNYLVVKDNIQVLIDSGYSTNEICEKLFGGVKKGNTVFDILESKTRKLSESIINAYLQGKLQLQSNPFKYRNEWHITWEGKEVYLRSSYESEYANYLDENKIKYEVESLRIKYFNTITNEYHCAVPDFYLTESNTIIEIKSLWTLNLQEMKDKAKSYKEQGFNFKLILEHKEVDIDTL